MTNDMNEKFHQLFGDEAQSKSEETLETLKKMVQKDTGEREAELQENLTRSMLEGFNSMLVQITFDILLSMLDEEKQLAVKTQLYQEWKNQIELQISISDSVGSDSGLSDLFGYNDAMKNAFTAASNDILKYLKMETDTKNI